MPPDPWQSRRISSHGIAHLAARTSNTLVWFRADLAYFWNAVRGYWQDVAPVHETSGRTPHPFSRGIF